jgi:hypothetical protein
MIMLQLKRKKEFKSSILNQNIRPAKIMAGLNYLICNNPLFKDIHRNTDAFSQNPDSEHEWSQLIDQQDQVTEPE